MPAYLILFLNLVGFYTLGVESNPLGDLTTKTSLNDISSTSGKILEQSSLATEQSVTGIESLSSAAPEITSSQHPLSSTSTLNENKTEVSTQKVEHARNSHGETTQIVSTSESSQGYESTTSKQNAFPDTSTSYYIYGNGSVTISVNTTSNSAKSNLTFLKIDERAGWFAVTSFKEARDDRTVKEIVNDFAAGQFAEDKSVITIINYSGDKMSLQCKSAENDLGSRMLPDQLGFSFSFEPKNAEHFWCHAWWKDNYKEFSVYGKTQPKNVNTIWELYGYGLYLDETKKYDWEKYLIQKAVA